MNPNLSFIPPLIDCERRNYDVRIQKVLEAMVQREPKKRTQIQNICNIVLLKSSPLYNHLLKEDKQFP